MPSALVEGDGGHRVQRRTGLLLGLATAVGCITPYAELPLCGDGRGAAPTTHCSLSPEVEAYRARLAGEVLRRSQWQYPAGLPLQVELDEARRVNGVCLGDEQRKPGWSTRDRVASSLGSLRSASPGPTCVAGTTIDLSSTLLELSVPDWAANLPLGMTSCETFRDKRCTSRLALVCAVYRDGRRRTYANACQACDDRKVVGFFDFECQP